MDSKVWSEQLLTAMINADRSEASNVIEQALATGVEPRQVVADILDPAIVQLGSLWEDEAMSLAQNFVASKIAEDTLLRCIPVNSSNPTSKGAVVIGNIEDDFHSLGRNTVGLFLSAAGWDVHDLGNDVPAEDLMEKALEVNASVIGVSAMMQTTALNTGQGKEAPRLKSIFISSRFASFENTTLTTCHGSSMPRARPKSSSGCMIKASGHWKFEDSIRNGWRCPRFLGLPTDSVTGSLDAAMKNLSQGVKPPPTHSEQRQGSNYQLE